MTNAPQAAAPLKETVGRLTQSRDTDRPPWQQTRQDIALLTAHLPELIAQATDAKGRLRPRRTEWRVLDACIALARWRLEDGPGSGYLSAYRHARRLALSCIALQEHLTTPTNSRERAAT